MDVKPTLLICVLCGGPWIFFVFCKKHNVNNAQKRSQTFSESPSRRLKEDSLRTHMALSVHSSEVEVDLLQRMSVFHHNYVERNEVPTTVLQNVFATAFFLMKEFIANRKLIPLLSFMENVLGLSQLKHFSHLSQGSVREIYLVLGETVVPFIFLMPFCLFFHVFQGSFKLAIFIFQW